MGDVATIWRPLVFEVLLISCLYVGDVVGSILGPTWVCHFSQVESSTSGFTPSGGSSSVSMIASRKPTDGASSSNCVTDISHLVRKKRKPEEESPRKDDAKKAKQEPEVNGGSGDTISTGTEVAENMEEEVGS